jgi:hypothetical protein
VACAKGEEQRLRQQLHREYQATSPSGNSRPSRRSAGCSNTISSTWNCRRSRSSSEDLFSQRTWEFLGLSDRQIILAGALGGAALGAGIDAATIGTSFGLFSAIGGLIGAGATALKGKELLSEVRLLGMRMGGRTAAGGPVSNIQLLYILLDRGLLFYAHVINWAHGRRDYERDGPDAARRRKSGFTSRWHREQRKICDAFFRAVQKGQEGEIEEAAAALQDLLRLTSFRRSPRTGRPPARTMARTMIGQPPTKRGRQRIMPPRCADHQLLQPLFFLHPHGDLRPLRLSGQRDLRRTIFNPALYPQTTRDAERLLAALSGPAADPHRPGLPLAGNRARPADGPGRC